MDWLSRKDSDDVLLDFHDVFGGPPRRASMQEWRNSISGDARAAGVACGDPWKAQGEKPVFGGESHVVGDSSRRRMNVSEDFFDDIFWGSDAGGSPHVGRDSDVFVGSPRSWVLSPAKPLPEALGNSSALAQFSLPAKVSRTMDSPFSGTSYMRSSKASLFRYHGTMTQVQEDMKRGGRSVFSPSPLSPSFAVGNKEAPNSVNLNVKEDEMEHAKNPQGAVDFSNFHFSIYRWASKSVPIFTPLRRVNSTRMREKASPESLFADEHHVEAEDIPLSSTRVAVPMETLSGEEGAVPDNSLTKKSSLPSELEGLQTVEEVILPTVESETQSSNVPNGSADAVLPGSMQPKTLLQHFSQDMDMEPEEPSKRVLKPLPSVLYDKESGKGNHEDNDQKIGGRHRKLRKSEASSISANAADVKKTQENGSNSINDRQVNNGSVIGTGTNAEGDRSSGRASGKVKEYIHIFGQENLPMGKPDANKQNESTREKERAIPIERRPIHTVSKLDNVLQAQSLRRARSNGSAASNREENNTTKNIFSDASSEQKSSSESSTESASDEIRATVIEVEESFNDNFMIKELGKHETKVSEPNAGLEEFQAIDEKIRKWSRGKEGNIRSLLSTLQYVLWPNSGWKPVPLVDIIEGPAVKRAYQKALLCLHPDKLQQKGAALHQKHTAEQVYEILQEAWGHFSSLGVL